MSDLIQPERQVEPDGAAVDVFTLPVDEASLEKLLRELSKLRGEESPPGRFAPGQQGFFSRLRDAFNGR